MKLDEITVMMPVHNSMPFLREAIDSLLQQTILDKMQILILNDHSTDESIEYIIRINHPKIKIITPPVFGLVNVLNYGLGMVQTEFVARMDSDDISLPHRLEYQLNFLKENVDIGLTGARGKYIGEKFRNRVIPIHCPVSHNEIIFAMLKRRYAIIHPSIFFRKEIIDAVGLYRPEYFPSEDYDLFFRIGQKFKLANLPEYLYLVRIRNQSITDQTLMQSMKKYEKARILYLVNSGAKKPKKIKSIFISLDILSLGFYRKGLNYYLNEFSVKSYIYIFISIIFNPLRLLERVKKSLFTNPN